MPPIKVRKTPNGKKPYELVAGLHRLEGHRLAGMDQIEVNIIQADRNGAREEEIEENLFRNELTALERIVSISAYRSLFEDKFGKIAKGNPTFAKSAKLAEMDLLGNIEDSQEGHFFDRVKERLGLSRRSVERMCSIAAHLAPQLLDVLQGSPLEDNQAVIERVSKLELGQQIQYAAALKANGFDIAAVDAAFDPAPKLSKDERALETIVDGWTRTNAKVRAKFVADYLPVIGAEIIGNPVLTLAFARQWRGPLLHALGQIAPEFPETETQTEA